MRMWKRIARLFRRETDGGAAAAAELARLEAERRLAAAKSMWPQTRETRDVLAEMIESALRGRR